MTEFLFQIGHQVQGRGGGQVEGGIPVQHGIIKVLHVEPDHQLGPHQFLHQVVDLVLVVYVVLTGCRVVGHTDRHQHLVLVTPAADFGGALLGLQIEINNVFHKKITANDRK